MKKFMQNISKKISKTSKSRKSSMAPSVSGTSYGSVDLSAGGYKINSSDLGKIHLAVCEGNINKVKKLISNVNDQDKLNRTPLHFACANGNVDILELLIANKALPNIPDNDLKTPLMKAIECHQQKCAKILIKKCKIKYDVVDSNKNSILHYICEESMIEDDMSQLIPLFFNEQTTNLVAMQNKQGLTPLHLAIEQKNSEIVDLLLEKDIEVNIQDELGMTPLMLACKLNQVDIVESLVNYDADLSIKNNKGETAEDIAKKLGYEECYNQILNYLEEQQQNNVMSPRDDEEDDSAQQRLTKDGETGIHAEKIKNQLSMTQSIGDLEDTVNDMETFRSQLDHNQLEILPEDNNEVYEVILESGKENNINNVEYLNNSINNKPSTSNSVPFMKTFTNETKAFGFTFKPDPLQSEKSDWDDSISECSISMQNDLQLKPPAPSKTTTSQKNFIEINPTNILGKSQESSYLFDGDEDDIPEISTIKLQPNLSVLNNADYHNTIAKTTVLPETKLNLVKQNAKDLDDKESKSDWDSTDTEAEGKDKKNSFVVHNIIQSKSLPELKKVNEVLEVKDFDDDDDDVDIGKSSDLLDKSINELDDLKAINDEALQKFKTSASSFRRNSDAEDAISQKAFSRVGSIRSDIESVQVNLLEEQVKEGKRRLEVERNDKHIAEQKKKAAENERDQIISKMEELLKEKNSLEHSKRKIELNCERLQSQLDSEVSKKSNELYVNDKNNEEYLLNMVENNVVLELKEKLEAITSECNEAKSKVADSTLLNQQQKDEMMKLKIELDELKKELIQKEEELTTLNKDLLRIKQLNYDYTEQLEKQKKMQNIDLDEKMTQIQNKLTSCEKELRDKNDECLRLQALNTSMKEIVESRNDIFKSTQQDHSAMLIKLQEENSMLRHDHQTKLNEHSNIIRQKDDNYLENMKILSNAQSENHSLKRDYEISKNECKNLILDLNDLRKKYDDLNSQLKEESAKNKELFSKCSQLTEKLDESEIRCLNYQTRIKEIKTLEIDNTNIDENIQKRNFMRVEEKLHLSEEQNQSLSKQITDLMAKSSKLETEILQSDKEKGNLMVEIQQEKWRVEKAEEMNKYSEGRYKIELERQQEQYLLVLKQLETEIKNYEDKNEVLSSQVTEWLKKAIKLESELSFSTRLNTENEEKLTQEKKKIKKLMELKNSAELHLKAEKEKNEYISSENDRLKISLTSTKKKLRLNESRLQRASSNLEGFTSSEYEDYSIYNQSNLTHNSYYQPHLQSAPASRQVMNRELELFRTQLQSQADAQLNDKLRQVNGYLDKQAQSRTRLQEMHDSNEMQIKLNFEKTKNNLNEELNRLYKLHDLTSESNRQNGDQVLYIHNNILSALQNTPSKSTNSTLQMKREMLDEFSRIIKKHLEII